MTATADAMECQDKRGGIHCLHVQTVYHLRSDGVYAASHMSRTGGIGGISYDG